MDINGFGRLYSIPTNNIRYRAGKMIIIYSVKILGSTGVLGRKLSLLTLTSSGEKSDEHLVKE